ncbi:MAG: heavy metal translocating P-type ATPase [Desulfovibrio sp.]
MTIQTRPWPQVCVLPKGTLPGVVHQTVRRIRLRWRRLLCPSLSPEYLEAWIGRLEGVTAVRVNPRACSIVVEYDGREDMGRTLVQGLAEVPEAAFSRPVPAGPRRRLTDVAFHGVLAASLPLLPLAVQAPVAVLMGAPSLIKGGDTLLTQGLKARVLDMATIGFSLLRGDFVAASAISAMVVTGEYLRQATEDRSNGLLRSLVADPVESVRIVRDGRERTVGYEEVRTGDLVLVGVGELIPVDGEVRDGAALVDKSSLTGEFDPVPVKLGDTVSSGCAVIEGRIRVLAVRTGAETAMARIAGLMERALREKSEPERRSDRLADRLTPVTLALGAAIYAATGDAGRALSVLTVDYACAVKLPAPVVVKTAMYAAARQGVLIKSGSAMDAFAGVDALVLDKTGTLTTGTLALESVVPCAALDAGELLRLAAAVEIGHAHPVGRAIVEGARKRGLPIPPVDDADLSIAHGVSGHLEGALIRVGSHHYIAEDCGVECDAAAGEAERLHRAGMSVVHVSKNQTLLGVIGLREKVREEAGEVLAALRDLGVRRIVVLTGDHPQTADRLKTLLPGVDEVRAGLMPEGKAQVVRELQQAGHRVAVVGDGVNDAPAFVCADVGLCMSGGAGLARESAGIVLMRDTLDGLVEVRRIAARAGRVLDRCFQTGVTVNTGLLLAAGAGRLSPTAAAAIHNMTTFMILGGAALATRRAGEASTAEG